MTPANKVLFQVSSVMEYLVDRGEVEDIEKVASENVRYGPTQPLEHVDLVCDGKVVRVTATVVG